MKIAQKFTQCNSFCSLRESKWYSNDEVSPVWADFMFSVRFCRVRRVRRVRVRRRNNFCFSRQNRSSITLDIGTKNIWV